MCITFFRLGDSYPLITNANVYNYFGITKKVEIFFCAILKFCRIIMQRGIGLKISQEREIAPTDIAANKDIAAKTTTTDATADAQHLNGPNGLNGPNYQKKRGRRKIFNQ